MGFYEIIGILFLASGILFVVSLVMSGSNSKSSESWAAFGWYVRWILLVVGLIFVVTMFIKLPNK